MMKMMIPEHWWRRICLANQANQRTTPIPCTWTAAQHRCISALTLPIAHQPLAYTSRGSHRCTLSTNLFYLFGVNLGNFKFDLFLNLQNTDFDYSALLVYLVARLSSCWLRFDVVHLHISKDLSRFFFLFLFVRQTRLTVGSLPWFTLVPSFIQMKKL